MGLWHKDGEMKFREKSNWPLWQRSNIHMNGCLCFQMDNIYASWKNQFNVGTFTSYFNVYSPWIFIEHRAHNMALTRFTLVQSVLTTIPCALGILLTYSRMLFNLKINKTLYKRVQSLHSEAQLLFCPWVQLNSQWDYSHWFPGPTALQPPGMWATQMAPLWSRRACDAGTVYSVILQKSSPSVQVLECWYLFYF